MSKRRLRGLGGRPPCVPSGKYRMTIRRNRRVRLLCRIILAASLAAGLGVSWAQPGDRGSGNSTDTVLREVTLIIEQVPVSDSRHRESSSANAGQDDPLEGSRIVMARLGTPGDIRVLTEGFAAAAYPDLSADGGRVLFVASKQSDVDAAVWELELGTGQSRKIITPDGACDSAIYLSTIYTLDAGEPAPLLAFRARSGRDGTRQLYTCRMDGTRVEQITFDPRGVGRPYQLSDGRILFSVPRTRDAESRPPAASPDDVWMTVHVDGTDVSAFAGQYAERGGRFGPCETPVGEVLFVERGDGERQASTIVGVPRARSLTKRRLIRNDDRGTYAALTTWTKEKTVAAYRPATSAPDTTFGVYAMNLQDGRLDPIFDDPAWHDVRAIVVQPRPPNAGRSTVVRTDVAYGQLYGLDVKLTDVPVAAGDAAARRIRVIGHKDSAEFAPSASGSPVAESGNVAKAELRAGGRATVVLGESTIEADGSFYLEVPARTPIRLEMIDDDGRVVSAMHSWIWVMPMERRGCIGCHADPELAPPNRHPLALRRAPHRITEGAGTPMGAREEGYKPLPP